MPTVPSNWSGRRESNPRPTAWKAVTLPLSYSRLTCAVPTGLNSVLSLLPSVHALGKFYSAPSGLGHFQNTDYRPKLSTLSSRLIATFVALFPLPLLARRPGANGEHRQYRQRGVLEFRIAQRGPRQPCQHCIDRKGNPQPLRPGNTSYLNTLNRHNFTPKQSAALTLCKTGAQGRIRTSVARKERQIYSLLPLTARPPVHIRPSIRSPQLRKRPTAEARNRQLLRPIRRKPGA